MIDETAKRRLRDRIANVVAANPHLADTADGIVQWWLPSTGFEGAIDLIQDVLDELVAEGVLATRRMPDGGVVYGAVGAVGFANGVPTKRE